MMMMLSSHFNVQPRLPAGSRIVARAEKRKKTLTEREKIFTTRKSGKLEHGMPPKVDAEKAEKLLAQGNAFMILDFDTKLYTGKDSLVAPIGRLLDDVHLTRAPPSSTALLLPEDLVLSTHLITGFMGTDFSLKAVELIEAIRAENPDAFYLCDPVMGDSRGKVHVPLHQIDFYRDVIVPRASVVTPNHFEAELLVGSLIKTEAEAGEACHAIHGMGPPEVLITSLDFPGDDLILVGSDTSEQFKIRIPRINGHFDGAGELFSSLLLAYMVQGYKFKDAVAQASSAARFLLDGENALEDLKPYPTYPVFKTGPLE